LFLAGGSGVVGEALVPALVSAGHEVIAPSRAPDRADSLKAMGAHAATNDRVRGEGGADLLAAATAAGARRYVAQNVCFPYAPVGPRIVDEDAGLGVDFKEPCGRSVRIHQDMEHRIVDNSDIDGLVLRFGLWYGPGTTFAPDGYSAGQVRRRRYPVVGSGAGMFSLGLVRGDSGDGDARCLQLEGKARTRMAAVNSTRGEGFKTALG
jgi:2-alkyl-3-oxoalkanoate reductase